MSRIDPEQERRRLAKLYAGMSDGELEKIAEESAELTEWAREELRPEMTRRGLEWRERPPVTQTPIPEDALLPVRSYANSEKAAKDAALLDSARIRTHLLKRETAADDGAKEEASLLVRAADLADAIQVLRNNEPEEAVGGDNEPRLHHEIGKPVVLRRYRDITEAMVDETALESAGLQCFLYDDNLVRLDWFISNAIGGVKLVVSENDAEAASEILGSAQPS